MLVPFVLLLGGHFHILYPLSANLTYLKQFIFISKLTPLPISLFLLVLPLYICYAQSVILVIFAAAALFSTISLC